ncbi:MAG: NAD(P)-dependent oxidoreductase, partial [Desulfocapsaceae bacterium]
IGHKEFQRMRSNTIFINTARAGLIDQDALAFSLRNGLLAGAGLDDLDLEHATCSELLHMDQVVVTSHMGFYTREAIQTKTTSCVKNVIDYADNHRERVSR